MYTLTRKHEGTTHIVQYVPIEDTDNYLMQSSDNGGRTFVYVTTHTFLEVEKLVTYFRTQEDVHVEVAMKTTKVDEYGRIVYTNDEMDAIIESYRITPNRWLVAGIIIEQSDGVTLRNRVTGEAREGVSVWELLVEGWEVFPFVDNFECIEEMIMWEYAGELGRY